MNTSTGLTLPAAQKAKLLAQYLPLHSLYGPSKTLCSRRRKSPRSASSHAIHNSPVMLRSRDLVECIEPCQHEFDAGRPNRRIARSVHLEGLVPHRWHAFEPVGVLR